MAVTTRMMLSLTYSREITGSDSFQSADLNPCDVGPGNSLGYPLNLCGNHWNILVYFETVQTSKENSARKAFVNETGRAVATLHGNYCMCTHM